MASGAFACALPTYTITVISGAISESGGIYKQMVLNLPRRTKKCPPKIIKELLIAPQEPNIMRALDLMYDTSITEVL